MLITKQWICKIVRMYNLLTKENVKDVFLVDDVTVWMSSSRFLFKWKRLRNAQVGIPKKRNISLLKSQRCIQNSWYYIKKSVLWDEGMICFDLSTLFGEFGRFSIIIDHPHDSNIKSPRERNINKFKLSSISLSFLPT